MAFIYVPFPPASPPSPYDSTVTPHSTSVATPSLNDRVGTNLDHVIMWSGIFIFIIAAFLYYLVCADDRKQKHQRELDRYRGM
jgi:hypothetical protein